MAFVLCVIHSLPGCLFTDLAVYVIDSLPGCLFTDLAVHVINSLPGCLFTDFGCVCNRFLAGLFIY